MRRRAEGRAERAERIVRRLSSEIVRSANNQLTCFRLQLVLMFFRCSSENFHLWESSLESYVDCHAGKYHYPSYEEVYSEGYKLLLKRIVYSLEGEEREIKG
jgi:hypothetical protein